jgi:hypothetical protein
VRVHPQGDGGVGVAETGTGGRGLALLNAGYKLRLNTGA